MWVCGDWVNAFAPKPKANPKRAGARALAGHPFAKHNCMHIRFGTLMWHGELWSRSYKGLDHPKRVPHTQQATRLMRNSTLNLTSFYTTKNEK